MKHFSVEQGSQQWHDLRSTIPTASNFDRLITPSRWEPTKGETRRNYMLELLANRIFGLSAEDQFSSAAMDHGREWEPIARAAYEFERGVQIEDGGFFTDDGERFGASPDGLIGTDGLVEFKNPASPRVHLSALLDASEYSRRPAEWTIKAVPADIASGSDKVTGFLRDHWVQVQGQLMVTGRKWCDVVSNFARLPMVVVRIYPNPEFQFRLSNALSDFCVELSMLTDTAERKGWYRPSEPQMVGDGLDISDADVDAILAASKREGVSA